MDMIWELDTGTLAREETAEKLIAMIEKTPAFVPDQYDLNERGAHKPYGRDHVVVDLLTQRTQFLRIETQKGEFAVIATGKHGEQPVMMMRWEPGTSDPDRLTQSWEELFDILPIGRAILTDEAWMASEGPALGVPGFVLAFPAARVARVEDVLKRLAADGRISLDRYPSFVRVISSADADRVELGKVLATL